MEKLTAIELVHKKRREMKEAGIKIEKKTPPSIFSRILMTCHFGSGSMRNAGTAWKINSVVR